MHWDAYTIFSVLSGVTLVILAMVPGLSGKDRLWALLGGVAFGGYGIYVANQTSGTFVFPIWVFIIPVVAAIYIAAQVSEATKAKSPVASRDEEPGAPASS